MRWKTASGAVKKRCTLPINRGIVLTPLLSKEYPICLEYIPIIKFYNAQAFKVEQRPRGARVDKGIENPIDPASPGRPEKRG